MYWFDAAVNVCAGGAFTANAKQYGVALGKQSLPQSCFLSGSNVKLA
ncbi:hypothetical protein [Photobacterium sanctipauli]|nr:hypothetical protein [Photobacterium sanctipauli]